MVTGGYTGDADSLDSTETFDGEVGSWAISGAKLPRKMSGLRAANIDNRVLIFGDYIIFITYMYFLLTVTKKKVQCMLL